MAGGPRYSGNIKLEPPTDNAHPITFIPKFTLDEWRKSSNNSTISCYAQNTQSIYIEHTGRVFPCCPLSSALMYNRTINFNDSYSELWSEHGEDRINLKHNKWDDIINGPFFTSVQDRWTKDYANGRIAACAGVCSNSELKFNNKNGSN